MIREIGGPEISLPLVGPATKENKFIFMKEHSSGFPWLGLDIGFELYLKPFVNGGVM